MAALFGSGRINDTTPPATSLRIQTALNGQPIAIVHGQQRLAGNLIWYGGFASSGGGKGGKGGLGDKGGSAPTYSADVAIALAEGPIAEILTVWSDQTITGLSELNLTAFNGGPGQAPWGFLSAEFPQAALGYSWLGYLGADPFDLGASPALPNLNFEVRGGISGAVTETYDIVSPYTFTPSYFSLASSVTEQVSVPATSPYTVQAQNWQGVTALPVVIGQTNFPGQSLIGSGSDGVIDINGRVFTRLSSPVTDGSNATGTYWSDPTYGLYYFSSADAGLAATIVDLAIGPGVSYCYKRPNTIIAAGSTTVSSVSTTNLVPGMLVLGAGIPPGTVVDEVGGSDVILSQTATLSLNPAALVFVQNPSPLEQGLGGPMPDGWFSVSAQAGTFGQYTFSAGDAGASVIVVDVPDAGAADSLTDFLSNPRYGCGFPAANIGDLSQLTAYTYGYGLFISPAIVASQAANAYLGDFSTGLNGEFVWSAGLLTFVPYGDGTVSANGKSYTPPGAPLYSLDDDDFLKNEGTASIGVSAFTSDDPVVCVRTRPSDAYNDIKVEYLDRGNSYNPAIVEAQDDAAINAYGLRPADTKQLHFFCIEQAALVSAQLQLGRQQVRNLYSFTVPWYFILLDPMDIVAITDAALGLDQQWVRIREITENQQDGTLTITAEEYLGGPGQVALPLQFGSQPKLGFATNAGAAAPGVN